MLINTTKFMANLVNFGKLDDKLQEMFCETAAYVSFQWHVHGNKDAHTKLLASAMPEWIKDGFRKLPLGKRDRNMNERTCQARADALTAIVFMAQAEKRAAAKIAREAKAAEVAALRAKVVQEEVAKNGVVADIEVARAANNMVLAASRAMIGADEGAAFVFGDSTTKLTPREAEAVSKLLAHMRAESEELAA